ncbi:MAG: hypothetical protein JWQ71_2142 [Pedosphaera sp.]|nr:hypothetical protein [Pedosphaera sp.]
MSRPGCIINGMIFGCNKLRGWRKSAWFMRVGFIAMACLLVLTGRASAVPPANDTCAGAEVIPPSGPFPYFSTVTADVTGATTSGDPLAPTCVAGSISRSIWYRFTPSATKLYTISSGDDTATTVFDTVMAVYTSTGGCGGLYTRFACNDDSGGLRAAISATLNAGTTYYIVVWVSGSSAPAAGSTAVQLRISQPVAPANDGCVGAEIIPSSGPFPYLTAVADITLATITGDPPAPSCNTNFSRSVWYRFVPGTSAVYTLSTCSDTATTVYDTLLTIYTSPSGCGGPYTAVACNDNSCDARAAITTTLTAGTTYYIVIWEASANPYTPGETSVQLRISGFFPPTVNTVAASSVTSTGAVLNAVINPNNVLTTGWFEWGTTTNYGNVTAAQNLGNGSGNVLMSATLTGLATTTYFFRAKATNNLGTSLGINRTFARSLTPPQFNSFLHLPNGNFHSQFSGNPGQSYLIQASTNLVDWPVIGSPIDLGNGFFQFDDATAPSPPKRFYRVVSP